MKNRILWIRKLLLLALCVVFGLTAAQPALASEGISGDYDGNRRGSITVELDNIGTNRGGVGLAFYQVGVPEDAYPSAWVLKTAYAGSKVDLNSLTEPENHRNAADRLWRYVEKNQISPEKSGITDQNGKLVMADLEQGVWLVGQTSTKSYGTVQPFLIAVPYMVDGQTWLYDVTTETKGERLPSLTPTKRATPTPAKKVTVTPAGKNPYNPNTPAKKSAGTISKKTTKTGDRTPVESTAATALLALLAVGALTLVIRRRKHS